MENIKHKFLERVGNSIREKLKESGVPQKEFAKRIPKIYGAGNISASELSRYLNCKTTMRTLTLNNICKELGFTLYDFIDDLIKNYCGEIMNGIWGTKEDIKRFNNNTFDLKGTREETLTRDELSERLYDLNKTCFNANPISIDSIPFYENETESYHREIGIYDFLIYFFAIMNCHLPNNDEDLNTKNIKRANKIQIN